MNPNNSQILQVSKRDNKDTKIPTCHVKASDCELSSAPNSSFQPMYTWENNSDGSDGTLNMGQLILTLDSWIEFSHLASALPGSSHCGHLGSKPAHRSSH